MKKTLLLGIPILLIAGLVIWQRSTSDENLDATHGDQAETQTSSKMDPSELVEMTTDPDKGSRDIVDAEPSTADTAGEQVTLGEGERWLEGRVEWPTGQGWEESLTVYVLSGEIKRGQLDGVLIPEEPEEDQDEDPIGEELNEAFRGIQTERLLAQAKVSADGTFRIPLPVWRPKMHLQLLGRHLYMEMPRRVPAPPWNESKDTVILQPKVGVWVHGQLMAPPGADWTRLTSRVLLYKEISPTNALVPGGGKPVGTFVCRSNAEGEFELRGLPVDEQAPLQVWPSKGAPTFHPLDEFSPGASLEALITLDKGRTIAGLVVDPDGNPVEGAQVGAYSQAPLARARGVYRSGSTDALGQFELIALPKEKLKVQARHPDWLHTEPRNFDATDPSSEVVLTLQEGASLSGILTLPDGRPAADVSVLANLDGLHIQGIEGVNMLKHQGSRSKGRTDEAGRFHLLGLAKLPYKLGARTERDGTMLMAFLDNQRPQEEEVHMELWPSPTLTGVVVDKKGEPVTNYTLLAREARTASLVTVYFNEHLNHVANEEGRFHLEDLRVGHWQLIVQGENFLSAPPFEVDLPLENDSEPIVITVSPARMITGRVLAPDGQGVHGAEVIVQGQGLDIAQTLARSALTPKGISGPDGTFKMGPFPDMAVALMASADDWCESLPVSIELNEDVETTELVLEMRHGGTLIVEVFGSDGEVSPLRMIQISNPGAPVKNTVQMTDHLGLAFFEHLAEGTYNVIALGDATKMMDDLDRGVLNQADIFANLEMGSADIKDQEETRISLGSPPANPIAISGTVTRGGAPIADAIISFSANGKSILEALAIAEVDGNGHYETILDGAGRYRVTVQITGGKMLEQTTVEFVRDIAEGESAKLDLELPEGSISGVVTTPNGRPAARVRISLQASGPTSTDTMLGGSFVERKTADDGSFEIKGLQGGTYTVFAGGASPYGLGTSEGPKFGRVASAPIHLREDQSVSNIRLRLVAPGSISCRVMDDAGLPVEGASIFVRDSAGRPIEAFSLITTQATGLCTYSGLAPGSYTVSARSSELACAESAPITVKAGETTDVALTGRSGTVLRLLFKDVEGDPKPANLQVLNDQGLDMMRMFGAADMAALYSKEPFLESERRIGPLPPGRYKVIATIDGKTVEKSVRLRGKPTKRLTLRAR
ncbi:MAG: carboxypeptidase regulatory-like domain-containing protein [bacterium]|nr:carboxypeptidase regulatory-like domain-containing protein [bacterium]